ncbi:4Fe-4S cluster-binding domain-containing protein [Lachnospiraceae bacterium MD308]|nr:4Fe-4S cluster-binding domain-containing protein [Lachnospiraceae bacterium MD308]
MGLVIWTTTQCNLNCTYCYETIGGQKNKARVAWDFQKFLEKIYEKYPQMLDLIIFHGGEPLLNYELIGEVSNFIKNKGWDTKFAFTTNGTIWNEKIRAILLNNAEAFKEGISISIDGTKENHDLCRKNLLGEGSYDKVANTLNLLLNDFPGIYARMTVGAKSVDCLFENVKHIGGLGVKRISLAADFFDSEWTEDIAQKLEEECEKIVQYWLNNQDLEISIVEQTFKKRKLGGCSLSYNVYTDGKIYPCTYLAGNDKYVIGNISDGIDEEKVERLKNTVNADYEFCSTCENIRYCIHNRCKLMNAAVCGDTCEPSHIGCRIEHIKFKLYQKYHADVERRGANE